MDNFFNWLSETLGNIFSAVIKFFVDFLLSFLGIIGGVISSWMVEQGFSLAIPSDVFNVLDEITYGIGYILPLYALMPIVAFMLVFYYAKIVFALFTGVTKFFRIG